MNRTDIAHQISLTLGDHAEDYDIDGIVNDLIAAHDGELNSIDDVDTEAYWAIVETHDNTAAEAVTHFTAWLTVTPSALDQDNVDVTVLEDENLGGDGDDANWACKGEEALFTGITGTPADDGDHVKAQAEAVTLLADAGWDAVGAWETVDTGYIITVEKA